MLTFVYDVAADMYTAVGLAKDSLSAVLKT